MGKLGIFPPAATREVGVHIMYVLPEPWRLDAPVLNRDGKLRRIMGTRLWGNGILRDASVRTDSNSFARERILEVEVALHEVSYSSVARTAHEHIDGRCSKPIGSVSVNSVRIVQKPVTLCADVQHSLNVE